MYAGNFNPSYIFTQIDTKSLSKIYPSDLINYLTIHRIAASER